MAGKEPKSQQRPRHYGRAVGKVGLLALLILAALLVLARLLLPSYLRDYVNRTLDRSSLYSGAIGRVDLRLLRGAYDIEDIHISKTTGNVPVPLFEARRVSFAIQWEALLQGKIVGQILIDAPEINFVDAGNESASQTGSGGAWLEIIRDLFPFRINRAIVRDGSIHFRTFGGDKPLDVYLSDVQASIDNLGNIRDELTPLVSTVKVTARAMDQARFECNMALDPFSYRPSFELAARLLGLDVTEINDLTRAYGKFDFENGWFDLVIEAKASEGQLKGYVKPLFRNLRVLGWDDIRSGNPLQIFWEALVGAATSLLKNQSRDQFGTLIPFTGDLSATTTADILATVGNIFRNAFIRAYLPRLERGAEASSGLEFAPPEFHDPISAGDSPS